MKKFDGKKLLMLGTNVASVDIVQYAKENGAYTFVADYLDKTKSRAKLVCDEPLLINTADTGKLIEVVKQRKIDAVMAGVSEFNLLQAMAVSEACGLKFYCNKRQWDLIENKKLFRELCIENGVPAPKTVYRGSYPAPQIDSSLLPLVIKPVDGSSSKGVTICTSNNDIGVALEHAFDNSGSREIIIEEFVEGDEFSAHYTISSGKASLSCVDNRYPAALHEGTVTTIPIARVYPSSFLDAYIKKVNPQMISLCESIGISNGVLFVQGIHTHNDDFRIFEAGLRSAGEAPYRILSKVNHVNYFHMMVDEALAGCTDYDSLKEDPCMNGKTCATISLATPGGKVGRIEGIEEVVTNIKSIVGHECRYPVGAETPYGDTLRQIMIRFVLICNSTEDLVHDIDYINSHVNVYDKNGKDMCVKFYSKNLISRQ